MIYQIIYEETEEERKERVKVTCVICKKELPEEAFNHNTEGGIGVCERCQENGR